jgi:hypothetical protein
MGKLKKRGHLGVITDAFVETMTGGDILEQDWYKARLAACEACEFNTDNQGKEALLRKAIHLGQPSCSLCGCFIKEKCTAEEVSCSLADHPEKGMEPKWMRRKVITSTTDDFNLINAEPDRINIGINAKEGNFEVVLIPDVSVDEASMSFILQAKDTTRVRIVELIPTCGCTNLRNSRLNETDELVSVTINTTVFGTGMIGKSIRVKYTKDTGKGDTKELFLEVMLMIKMKRADDWVSPVPPPQPQSAPDALPADEGETTTTTECVEDKKLVRETKTADGLFERVFARCGAISVVLSRT